MDKMAIYNRLPVLMQNLACNYEGSKIKKNRFGDDFWKFLAEYENRNDWTYEQLSSYRDNKMNRMLQHCYETVPYYTKLFDKLGIDYRDIRTIDDLQVIPILNKETVRDNFNEFISTAIPQSKMIIAQTGGTTGSGFSFFTTKEAISEQWAVWWRYRRNLGIKYDTWCGLFGGKTIVPSTQLKPPFWRINAPCRQLYFSGFHINEKNWKYYADVIVKKNIKWLHGYPSNIANLASYLNTHGVKIKMDHITIGAENLLDYQIEIIEHAFGVKPYQHYGLAEAVANISQSTDGKLYIDEDFSVVEFVKHDDKTNRIIGTSLVNFAMPLVRFDTGDLVPRKIDESLCDENKNRRTVYKIDGRQSEYLVLSDGTKISGAVFNLVFKELNNIREAQVIQNELNSIIVRVVQNKEYTVNDENKLRVNLRDRLGKNVNISFDYVSFIERTKSGKLKAVVSYIDI